jgi:hypothetical protein
MAIFSVALRESIDAVCASPLRAIAVHPARRAAPQDNGLERAVMVPRTRTCEHRELGAVVEPALLCGGEGRRRDRE